MLRYNNQGGYSKPVDYFRPLTVDCSVEYELPKEVAPPPGSAPLLMILRRSVSDRHSRNLSPSEVALSPNKPSSTNNTSKLTHSVSSSSSYFLRSSGGGSSHHSSAFTSSNNLGGGGGGGSRGITKSVRYGNPAPSSSTGSNLMSSISRSRSMTVGGSGHSTNNCPYGKCDECASGGGGGGQGGRNGCVAGPSNTSSTSSKLVTNGGGGLKKPNYNSRGFQSDYTGEPVFASSNYFSQSHHPNSSSGLVSNSITSSSTSSSKGRDAASNNNHHQLRSSGVVGNNNSMGMMDCTSVGGSSNARNNSSSTIGLSTSIKRLRMSQQQQQNHHQSIILAAASAAALPDVSHQQQTHPEPLNLAVVAPSSATGNLHGLLQHQQHVLSSSPSSIYLNQRSALYKQQQQQQHQQQQQQQQQQQHHLQPHQQQLRSRSSSSSTNNAIGLNIGSSSSNIINNGVGVPNTHTNSIHQMITNSYMTTGSSSIVGGGYQGPHLSAINNLFNSATSATMSQTGNRFLKECPIPVDKGSGSDSGVCSENESDVSPPMAPYHSNNHLTRRSFLSQELPSSGCYCCCCPTTGSDHGSPGSKSYGGKMKSSSGKSSRSRGNNQNGSSPSVSFTNNYSSSGPHPSAYNVGSMMVIQECQLGNMLISCDVPMSTGNDSPMAMDSSSSPAAYRKWFVGTGVGEASTSSSASLGRWFQV